MTGRDLEGYVAAGIASDHECTTLEEAREKIRLGMRVMIREASNAHNLKALLPIITPKNARRILFVTDDRFPADFLFRLSAEEAENLRFQIETSRSRWGGLRYAPTAFTEQGVAMLSSVLRSPRAVHVNIEIMRAFVRLRGILATHKDLAGRLAELEAKYDTQFRRVFDAIRQLMTPPVPTRKQIGFEVREHRVRYMTRTGR